MSYGLTVKLLEEILSLEGKLNALAKFPEVLKPATNIVTLPAT